MAGLTFVAKPSAIHMAMLAEAGRVGVIDKLSPDAGIAVPQLALL